MPCCRKASLPSPHRSEGARTTAQRKSHHLWNGSQHSTPTSRGFPRRGPFYCSVLGEQAGCWECTQVECMDWPCSGQALKPMPQRATQPRAPEGLGCSACPKSEMCWLCKRGFLLNGLGLTGRPMGPASRVRDNISASDNMDGLVTIPAYQPRLTHHCVFNTCSSSCVIVSK